MPDVNTVGIILGTIMFLDALYSAYRIYYINTLEPVIKNILLTLADCGVGAFLIYGSLIEEPVSNKILLSVVVASAGTHIFRNIEWANKMKWAFCPTPVLWGMNNLKLAGLFFLLFCD